MTLHDSDAETAVVDRTPGSSDAVVGDPAGPGGASKATPPAPVRHGERRSPVTSAIGALRRLARPVPMLVVALVASLLWGVSLGLQVRSDNREASDRGEAVAAAESVAVSLTSYDHTRLEADFAAATGNLTEAFRADYTVATQVFRQLITQLHAKATASVLNAGLVSYGDGRAEVLVFVDQTVTNDSLKAPRLDRSRMRLTLEKQHGRWLVSGVFLV